jgi:hypothetical protein
MQRTTTMNIENSLEVLDQRIKLNVSVNDLRIIVGCLRAIEYQMKADDEPYLDEDGLALKAKLETLYKVVLKRLGL